MNVGDVVWLASLRKGDCFLLKGRRAIVVDWVRGDRTEDFTSWFFQDGGRGSGSEPHFKVTYLGTGSFSTVVVWPDGEETRLADALLT